MGKLGSIIWSQMLIVDCEAPSIETKYTVLLISLFEYYNIGYIGLYSVYT